MLSTTGSMWRRLRKGWGRQGKRSELRLHQRCLESRGPPPLAYQGGANQPPAGLGPRHSRGVVRVGLTGRPGPQSFHTVLCLHPHTGRPKVRRSRTNRKLHIPCYTPSLLWNRHGRPCSRRPGATRFWVRPTPNGRSDEHPPAPWEAKWTKLGDPWRKRNTPNNADNNDERRSGQSRQTPPPPRPHLIWRGCACWSRCRSLGRGDGMHSPPHLGRCIPHNYRGVALLKSRGLAGLSRPIPCAHRRSRGGRGPTNPTTHTTNPRHPAAAAAHLLGSGWAWRWSWRWLHGHKGTVQALRFGLWALRPPPPSQAARGHALTNKHAPQKDRGTGWRGGRTRGRGRG